MVISSAAAPATPSAAAAAKVVPISLNFIAFPPVGKWSIVADGGAV